MLFWAGILSLAWSLHPAHAHDWEDREGTFFNHGSTVLTCFKDIEAPVRAICWHPLHPGDQCQADAVGTGLGQPVFKIPNRCSYVCQRQEQSPPLSCRPPYVEMPEGWSAEVMLAAILHNGADHYGPLPWNRFLELMSGPGTSLTLPVIRCRPDWIPSAASGESCPVLDDSFERVRDHVEDVHRVFETRAE